MEEPTERQHKGQNRPEGQELPSETRGPELLTVAELEEEIKRLTGTCEVDQLELSKLYLALDKVTFRLRATRTRIFLLSTEIDKRKGK